MALCAVSANAQFEAGKTYVNASLSGFGTSFNKNNGFQFGIDGTAGHLIVDNVMLLGRLGYDHPGNSQNFLNIGVGARYYFVKTGISLGAGFSYEYGRVDGFSTNNFFFTPEVGYTFFLGEHVTIEPAAYVKMSFNDFKGTTTIGLRLGFGYFF